ncbi:MAG: phycobilisome protein [Cyanobacteria bacterium J06639_1]
MYPELQTLLYAAEERYLQDGDIEAFRQLLQSFQERMQAYEALRDNEATIFQRVANQLLEAYPKEQPERLERALKHWIAATRFASMAMLLNNAEYLERHLLEWLTEQVSAHQMQSIESTLHQLLEPRLRKVLSREQWETFQPYVEQIQAALLTPAPVA